MSDTVYTPEEYHKVSGFGVLHRDQGLTPETGSITVFLLPVLVPPFRDQIPGFPQPDYLSHYAVQVYLNGSLRDEQHRLSGVSFNTTPDLSGDEVYALHIPHLVWDVDRGEYVTKPINEGFHILTVALGEPR